MKLHQVIPIVVAQKDRAKAALTSALHLFKKPDLFNGQVRTYSPLIDGGEALPEERQNIQYHVDGMLCDTLPAFQKMLDEVLIQDVGNTVAQARIKVGAVVTDPLPATFLLFLEKQLGDLETLIKAMPVLDASERWVKNDDGNLQSEPRQTHRNQRVQRSHIAVPATDKHPAQVIPYHEDVAVGVWTTTRLSSAVSRATRGLWLENLADLRDAVRRAREEANSIELDPIDKIGEQLTDMVLSKRPAR